MIDLSEARRLIDEAEEISFDDLPEPTKKTVKMLSSKLGLKLSTAWDGIHGVILDFEVSGQTQRAWRLAVEDFKLIADVKGLRWVQMDAKKLTLGL